MRKDTNRTFFYFETENAGQTVVRVASEKAPMWGKSYDSIADAISAIKRRNSDASSFSEGRNSVTAVYETTGFNTGE